MKIARITTSILVLLALFSLVFPYRVDASASDQETVPWCGTTSETENWGFTFDLMQYHWTVNGEGYVSESAINEVDAILDKLNADNVSNTMILFLPANEVTIGPNCAGQFLKYMKLGNIDGPRADNGFAFLFMVDQENNALEVHYAPGGNMNALTPPYLKDMERLAQDTYATTGSMDTALVETIKTFDAYARSKYEPYYPPVSTSIPVATPAAPQFNWFACLCVIAILFLIILLFFAFRRTKGSSTSTNWSAPSGTYHTNPTSAPFHPSTDYHPQSPSPRPSNPPPSRGGNGSGKGTRVG